jgi:hypothetical protein
MQNGIAVRIDVAQYMQAALLIHGTAASASTA